MLLKCAEVCSELIFAMLPVFLSASGEIHDYLRFAETMLDKFAEALLARTNMQARLQTELQNRRFNFGPIAFRRESPHRSLSSGSSLLRHTLKEAWDHFLRPLRLKGAIFFVDDLQNITSICKADLTLIIGDHFQSFGIEMLNYGICFSAKSDYFAEPKALADPAVRFYTKLYLQPLTPEEVVEYIHSVFDFSLDTAATVAGWLYEKTLGHAYFLVCKQLSGRASEIQEDKLEPCWPAVLDQLGREKFSPEVSQLSVKGTRTQPSIREASRQRTRTAPVHREVPKGILRKSRQERSLIRTKRGRYKLYHPLFREFLTQAK